MFTTPLFSTAFVNQFAIDFNGNNQHLDFGDIANFDRLNDFSHSFWYKPTVISTRHFLLTKNDNTAALRGLQLLREADNTIQFLFINDVAAVNFILVTTTTTIPINQYTNVIITYDGSGNASGVTIYFDGVSQSLTIVQDTLTGTTLSSSALSFARKNDATGHLAGLLDECSIWNKELIASEVTTIFNNGKPNDLTKLAFSANLILFLRFTQVDKNNFPTIKDFSLSATNGTAINMANTDIVPDVP